MHTETCEVEIPGSQNGAPAPSFCNHRQIRWSAINGGICKGVPPIPPLSCPMREERELHRDNFLEYLLVDNQVRLTSCRSFG